MDRDRFFLMREINNEGGQICIGVIGDLLLIASLIYCIWASNFIEFSFLFLVLWNILLVYKLFKFKKLKNEFKNWEKKIKE
jgi:hypothetical protein